MNYLVLNSIHDSMPWSGNLGNYQNITLHFLSWISEFNGTSYMVYIVMMRRHIQSSLYLKCKSLIPHGFAWLSIIQFSSVYRRCIYEKTNPLILFISAEWLFWAEKTERKEGFLYCSNHRNLSLIWLSSEQHTLNWLIQQSAFRHSVSCFPVAEIAGDLSGY